MKRKNHIIIACLMVVLTVSCSEEYLVEDPPHLMSARNLYESNEGFQMGINGLYSSARIERYGYTSNKPTIHFSYLGTDIIFGPSYGSDVNKFGLEIQPSSSHYEFMWSWLYQMINSANTIIGRSEEPFVNWTDTEMKQTQGVARFFRAHAYRHLVNLFGDVPLSLVESGAVIKTDWVRTPVSEVRQQMVEDLQYAAENISGEPNSTGSNITNWVAKHYLAEVQMELGNNAEAITLLKDVVDNSPYKLVTDRYGVKSSEPGDVFSDMFLQGNTNRNEGNTENMWVLQTEENVSGGQALWNRRYFNGRYDKLQIEGDDGKSVSPFKIAVERGGRGVGDAGPTVHMMSLYKPENNAGSLNDDRGSEFTWRLYLVFREELGDVLPSGYNYGDTIWLHTDQYIYKNWQWTWSRKHEEVGESDYRGASGYKDWPYVRLAEAYLLLAEAQLKNGSAADAAATINVIRARANADPVIAADVDIDFILDERARELFGEAHRRYHLMRNDKWMERTALYNDALNDTDPEGWQPYGITERDLLLPIPQSIIDSNLDLEFPQNPGY